MRIASMNAQMLTPTRIGKIPVAVLFFAFQKHLVRGANDGAVKG